MLSKRALLAEGDFGHFRQAVTERQQRGATLLDLTNSNPVEAELDYDWMALQRSVCAVSLQRYAPDSAGERQAREAIVRHLHPSQQCESFGFVDVGLSATYHVDNLVLTSSTSEAYGYLFKLLCDPGDVVLVPEPSYPLFEQLARYEGVTLAGYPLRYDGAWHIDVNRVKQLATLKPKAIVLVAPNNPTGSCCSPYELEVMSSLGVPFIVDQVFSPYVRSRASQGLGVATDSDAKLVFTLDGLSKRCGLPQLKLAWIGVTGSVEAVNRACRGLNQIADAYLSPNLVTQGALDELLRHSGRTMHSVRHRLDTNWDTLERLSAQGWPVSLYHYQGGWSAMWRFPAYRSDEEWAYWCLQRGVVLQPGWLYDCVEPSTLVLSLLSLPPTLEQAGHVLAEALVDE